MTIHLLTCIFPLFCEAAAACAETPPDVPTRVSIRYQDDRPIAEFFTVPGNPPWPAAVVTGGLGTPVWSVFSSGELHGSWMLTTLPDSGRAMVSHHPVPLLRETGPMAAEGRCEISEEEA